MDNVISGSFAEFNPSMVIDQINTYLSEIEELREKEKADWFNKKREAGKTTGFWFFKKTKPWDEEELLRLWQYGHKDDWTFETPKYRHWDSWNTTIQKFDRIKTFCQLATDAGNSTVNLSKEDVLWALNWR